MKKLKTSSVIVVEGKTDKDLIQSFLDVDVVTTNGSEVSRETINYIKEIAKKRTVIVLTDPDAPGKRIRDMINQAVPEVLNAFVPKEKSIKRHKVGVAESSKEVIMEALENLIPSTPSPSSDLTMGDLYDLGLIGNQNASIQRKKYEEKYHLGHTNAKTMLSRLRALGLTKDDLEENGYD
jgi:ribonuclease M5